MSKCDDFDVPRSEWEHLIDEWIFDEIHRKILKRNLLDGRTYEQLSYEFELSKRHISRLLPKLHNQLFKHIK